MADNPQKEARKWAGKYDSPEAMEQGLMNMVNEFDRIKQEAQRADDRARTAEAQAKAVQAVWEQFQEQIKDQRPTAPVVDFQGDDPREIQRYIDAQAAALSKKFEDIPRLIDSRLQAILQPFSKAQEAKTTYASQNPDYDDNAINKFLTQNPGIKKTFDRFVSNPDTAEGAYDYAWTKYKASLPKTSGVDETKKRDAGAPAPGSGPSLASENSETGSLERLKALAARAQNSFSVEDELEAAKELFKGSKLLKDIEDMTPDWAKE